MNTMGIALQWFRDRGGKTFYSMTFRLGQIFNGLAGFDCSSAVYYALKHAGKLPADLRIGNTDSLYGDLERNGFTKVTDGSRREGDVFLWGKRGASGGAAGHTGMYLDGSNIIHCAAFANGIAVNNHDALWRLNGSPELTVYRYTGADKPVYTNLVDQIVEVGSVIKLDKIFTADDVQFINGIWQVRTHELCDEGFTWDDNGIPAGPLVEVDSEGYATPDQELGIGSKYKLPGKFYVFDVGEFGGDWLAQIEWSGLKFWVDIGPATEIGSGENGTPTPSQRPQPPVNPPTKPPVVSPETPPITPEDKPVPPVKPPEKDPHVVVPPVEKPPINKPKENEMAIRPEDMPALKVQSEKNQELADRVASSDEVQRLLDTVNDRTKKVVYIVGDSLIGLGIVTPNLAVALGWGSLVQIIALSSVLATAGAFLLTMFGIYKNGSK